MIETTPFAAAGKASVDTLFGLSSQALQGAEQLAALNLQVTKATLADLSQASLAALSATSPEDLLKLQTATLQALPPKAVAYARQVQDIVSSVVGIQRAAFETQWAELQAKFLEAVQGAFKDAPGSENAVALVKSAIAAANQAYEGANQASKQVSDAVAVNVTKFVEAA